jgi:hypothetical protein
MQLFIPVLKKIQNYLKILEKVGYSYIMLILNFDNPLKTNMPQKEEVCFCENI